MNSSEKAMKAIHQYLDEYKDEITEENINDYMQKAIKQYNQNIQLQREGKLELTIEEQAYEYYDEACQASSYKEAKRLIKKALELKPHFTDAQLELLLWEEDPIKCLKALKKLEQEEKSYLEKEDMFNKENISHFYGILETRPYMRILHIIGNTLKEMSCFRKAAEVFEYMITLNQNDNLGVRFQLMGIYAILEDQENMDRINDLYPMNTVPYHLFQAALSYKLFDLTKARRHIRELNKLVPECKKIFSGQIDIDDYISDSPPGYYKPYSIDELIIFMNDFDTLFFNAEIINFFHHTLNTKK